MIDDKAMSPQSEGNDDPSVQSYMTESRPGIAITMLAQARNWTLKTAAAGFVVISKEGIQR